MSKFTRYLYHHEYQYFSLLHKLIKPNKYIITKISVPILIFSQFSPTSHHPFIITGSSYHSTHRYILFRMTDHVRLSVASSWRAWRARRRTSLLGRKNLCQTAWPGLVLTEMLWTPGTVRTQTEESSISWQVSLLLCGLWFSLIVSRWSQSNRY